MKEANGTPHPIRKCNGGPSGPWCGKVATCVCAARDGLQWFACDAHTEGAATEPIAAWFVRLFPGRYGSG